MALSRKIAWIDLSRGEVKTASIPVDMRLKVLGGRGIDIHLLCDSLNAEADPLSPDSVIVVSAGLLGGTLASASGRANVAAKSPLTGYLGGASIAGFFAPELRWAGFDHLVITGKAPKPSFLLVREDKVRILDASSVWGQTAPDTQEALRKELRDDDIQVLCIGPAGENLVRFATVVTRRQNTSRCGGMGAVFGSKNLKAIVARGDRGIHINHPQQALEYDREIVDAIATGEFGRGMQTRGVASLEGPEDKDPSDFKIGPDGCHVCQLHCWDRYVVKNGPYAGSYGQGPGYQVRNAWAPVDGDRPGEVMIANYQASLFGLDNMETANAIAWAIWLYEEGILTDTDTGGMKLRWGDSEAVQEIMRRIARREGLGRILGEGVQSAAQTLGRGSSDHIAQVKRLSDLFQGEILNPWQALGVAGATRGYDHLRYLPACDFSRLAEPQMRRILNTPVPYQGSLSGATWEYAGKPWLVLWQEMCSMAADMLGICEFHTMVFNPDGLGFDEFSRLVYLNTGLELSPRAIWEAANRAFSAERAFNLREGYESKDDWPDDRLFATPSQNGSRQACLERDSFQTMLREYYLLHGWDERGIPKGDSGCGLSASELNRRTVRTK